jgi:hypothetical protein
VDLRQLIGYLDPFNPGIDHGPSDFDIRQRFVFAPIYQTQWFKNNHGLAARLLGGYELTGIYTVRTGTLLRSPTAATR